MSCFEQDTVVQKHRIIYVTKSTLLVLGNMVIMYYNIAQIDSYDVAVI